MKSGIEPGIVVTNGARLADFYCEGLGFHLDRVLSFPQGEVFRLSRGPGGLKLFQPVTGAEPQEPDRTWSARAGFAYAALACDDVELVLEHARSFGAVVLHEVESHRRGARYAMISDPEGNVWELLEDDGAGD